MAESAVTSRVTITINGNETIELNKGISDITFKHDSDDKTKALDIDSVTGILVNGKIEKANKDATLQLAKWSIQTSGTDLYRNVTVSIVDNEGLVVRQFEFSEMFVVDYLEVFDASNDDEAKFTLKLYQRKNNPEIEIYA